MPTLYMPTLYMGVNLYVTPRGHDKADIKTIFRYD